MRIFFSGLNLGFSQGISFVSLFQSFVESNHEVGRRQVVHFPETGHDRTAPGVEEPSCQPHQIIPVGNLAEAGFAGAQSDQVCAQLH